jgi:hypothetical protein
MDSFKTHENMVIFFILKYALSDIYMAIQIDFDQF